MAASSVTGVGQGSADGRNKGSDHMSLGVSKLIGPRVVAAGVVSLVDASSKSEVTVTLEAALSGADTDYIVVATIAPVTPTAAIAAGGVSVSAFDASAGTFVLTSADTFTHPINWTVIKVK